MSDVDPVHDLLRSAARDASAAAQPLPAGEVRRRAEARTRRGRVLAGAGAVTGVLVAALAVGAATGTRDQTLQYADPPAATALPTPVPSGAAASPAPVPPPVTPPPLGGPSPVGPVTAAPEPQAPTPDARPAAWAVQDAFLPPAAAAAAEEPGWSVDATLASEPGPLFAPCGAAAHPLAGAVLASDERQMSSEREAGGSSLRQEVFRYRSPQVAAQALAAYVAEAARCPVTAEGTERAVSNEVVERSTGQVLVRRRSCYPECSDIFTGYVVLAQTGDGLTVVSYGVGEDGDPADAARSVAAAVRRQLAEAVEG